MQPMIMQMLLSQLQQRNPQGFQTIQNLATNKGDPSKVIKQIMQNMPPAQRQNILAQAKGYGAPNDILSEIQNM